MAGSAKFIQQDGCFCIDRYLGSPDSELLDRLATWLDAYEPVYHAIEAPDPIDVPWD